MKIRLSEVSGVWADSPMVADLSPTAPMGRRGGRIVLSGTRDQYVQSLRKVRKERWNRRGPEKRSYAVLLRILATAIAELEKKPDPPFTSRAHKRDFRDTQYITARARLEELVGPLV